MPIEEGQQAPDFTLYSDENKPFTLSDNFSARPALVLFFPGAFTTVCTTELAEVNGDYESFGGDEVAIMGISTDSPFVLREFKRVNKFQFPLLSDHDAMVSARYGAKYDHNYTSMKLDRVAKRAAFVIDRKGIIRYAEVLDSAGDLPDFDAVRRTIHRIL